MSTQRVIDPVRCPACGEERLVEVDRAARAWFCQVCGQSGVVPPAPSADELRALLLAVVRQHLAPGPWQIVAVAPLAHWPQGLQRELTLTLGALPDSVVLVLERVPS